MCQSEVEDRLTFVIQAHLTSSSDANARTFNQSSGLPSEPVQPQPASFAKHDAAGPGAGAGTFAGQHATTEQPAHSQPEVAARKGRIDPQPLDAQRTDESTEQHDEHRKKAEAAAGAALGTAGAAGAVEGLEAVGGSKVRATSSPEKHLLMHDMFRMTPSFRKTWTLLPLLQLNLPAR